MSNKIISDYRSEALQGSIKLVDDKGNEKICIGTKPIMISNQWKPFKVTAKKGDIITMDGKDYRVLKIDKDIAEVMCMYDTKTDQDFGNNNTYAGSDLDTYCNSTFYNSLSASMQNAIIAKTFQQDSWRYGDVSGAIIKYNGTYEDNGTKNYTLSLMSTTYGSSISRKCYVLSCQDVIDYLEVTASMSSVDTTLTSENVGKMFWNQTTSSPLVDLWTRSADNNAIAYEFCIFHNYKNLNHRDVNVLKAVRPAFQIDLSKIDYAIL